MSDLFFKTEKVLTLKDVEGVPCEIQRIDAPELLPLCLKHKCTMEDFNKWLQSRNIPDNREGFSEMKHVFGLSWLQNKNFASLTDQYWIKKRTETWKKINFFTNLYSKDIGDMAFSPWSVTKKRIDSNSPDLTTGGILRKRWLQNSDRSSVLIKAGSEIAKQEPLNEVLVSVLVEQLSVIKSAGYDLHIEGIALCSRCNNFITEDTDLVPAHYIYSSKEKPESSSVYEHLVDVCNELDIPGAKEYIDWLIFIDKLTANEDRHLGNIAFIRDVNSLKFIGPAPLFDCGSAYWNSKNGITNGKSKLFGNVEGNIFLRLKDKCKLESILKDVKQRKIIEQYPGLDSEKKERLLEAIDKRNELLLKDPEREFEYSR